MNFLRSIIVIFIFGNLYSQNIPKINSGVVSKTIKIGEQIDYFLSVEVDSVKQIEFPEQLQIAPFELLEIFPTDTQKIKNKYLLTKKYALIQFDSGYFQIPAQRVLVNGFSKLSGSVKIKVNDVIVDTVKQNLFNIKPLKIVKKNYDEIIKNFFYGFLIVVIIIILIFFMVRYQKKLLEKSKIIPPFEKAIKALKDLEKRDPKIQEEYKKYYSELTEIVRRYFDEEANIDALESTSDQLLLKLDLYKGSGKLALEESTINNLKTVLNTADLIKFAKAIPDRGVTELNRKFVEDVVIETKDVLPEPTIEELRAKKVYEEMLRLRKRKEILKWTIISTFSILIISTISLISIFGYYPFIDTLMGYPTKKLINNQWYNSQYGSPPIKVSTPKILQRKLINPNTSSLFVLDSIESKYYAELLFEKKKNEINSSTDENDNISSKEKTQKILNQTIERYQNQGAVNILIDAENYETSSSIPTLKLFGTLDFPKEKNKMIRCFFTTLIIDYKDGMISLTLIYEKDDRYGEEINNRIINSMELIKEL